MSSDSEVYLCTWNGQDKIRGYALVLNYEFRGQGKSERKGSNKDMKEVTQVLTDLGYSVTKHPKDENERESKILSKEATESVLQSFMEHEGHALETTDSTVVVVMSHGDSGNEWTGSNFDTEDGQFMPSQTVVDRFQTVAGLKGKPKMFFFNFCRGTLPDEEALTEDELKKRNIAYYKQQVRFWLDVDDVKNATPDNKSERPYNDTLIVYSTLPRYVSYRSEEKGSIFIQDLCAVFGNTKLILQKEILDLLKLVDQKLKKRAMEVKDDPSLKFKTQTPEIVIRGFNKRFYLLSFHKLKSYFLDMLCKVRPLPWYPKYNWSVDEIYTQLVIDRADEPEENLPVEDLFNRAQERCEHGSGYRILIEGDPGYGKSTFVLKVASDWSKFPLQKYISRFRLVLLAKLGEVDKDGDLEKHIWNKYKDKLECEREMLFSGKAVEQVLILLDGYDEAGEETKKTVQKIMEGELWCQLHVVLTSRFGYVTNDTKANALCTKLKGFEGNHVAVAVGKFFIKAGHLTKEAVLKNSFDFVTMDDFQHVQEGKLPNVKQLGVDQFKQFMQKVLKESPYKELAACPLLCSMLCCLVAEFPDRQLPENTSGLYFAIINRNLNRSAAKEAEPSGGNLEQWDLDRLKSKFQQEHQEYLKEFGSLCLEYIKNEDSHFTVFQLTGNSETAKPNNERVTQLVKAGVIVQGSATSMNSVYHPVHRSMAEFLAAYYLTKEKDTRITERHLLELYLGKTSFWEICRFCFELRSGKTVVDAFREVKLPPDTLKYFKKNVTNGAERFLQEIETALPFYLDVPKTLLPNLRHILEYQENLVTHVFKIKWQDSAKLLLIDFVKKGFNLYCEEGEICFLTRPSVHGQNPSFHFIEYYPEKCNAVDYLEVFAQQNIQLHAVKIELYGKSSAIEGLTKVLKSLLRSDYCPKTMSFSAEDVKDLPTLLDAFRDPPDDCKLERLKFKFARWHEEIDYEDMNKVMVDLGDLSSEFSLTLKYDCMENYLRGYEKLIKCKYLTCLRLKGVKFEGEELDLFMTSLLESNIEELKLERGEIRLESAQVKKYTAIATARCRLKKLNLLYFDVELLDQDAFDLVCTSFDLDTLNIQRCDISAKLMKWFGSSVCKLRKLGIQPPYSIDPRLEDADFFASVLNALDSKNCDTLQSLNLWFKNLLGKDILPLQLSIQRFQELKCLTVGMESLFDTPPSFLCEVLKLPRLKTLYPSELNSNMPSLFEALAALSYQWPGKDGSAPGQTESTLTLMCYEFDNVVWMSRYFRERDLDFRMKQVGQNLYEIWFPPKSNMAKRTRDHSPNGSVDTKVQKLCEGKKTEQR